MDSAFRGRRGVRNSIRVVIPAVRPMSPMAVGNSILDESNSHLPHYPFDRGASPASPLGHGFGGY